MLNPFEQFHQGKLVFGGQIEPLRQEMERQSNGTREGSSGMDGYGEFPASPEMLCRITKLVKPPDAYTPPWYEFLVVYRRDNSGSVSSSLWSLNQMSDTEAGSEGVTTPRAWEASGNLNVPTDGSALAVLRPAPGGSGWIFDWVGGVTYGIITDNASAPAYSFNEVIPVSAFSTTVAAQVEVVAGGRTGNAKAVEMYGNVNVPVGSIVMLHRGYCSGYNGTWDSNQEYYFLYSAGITARKNNANPKYGPYSQIDFIEGDNIEITVANDTPNKEINVTIGTVDDPTFGDVTIINNLYVTNIYVTFIEVTEINITNIYHLNYCTDVNKGIIGRIPVDYWRCTDVDGTAVWLNTPILYDFRFNAKGCVVMTASELETFKGGCCDDTCVEDPPPPCCPGLSGSYCAFVTNHNTTVGCDICDLPETILLDINVPGVMNRTVVLQKSETTNCAWEFSDPEPLTVDSYYFYLNWIGGLAGFRLQVFGLDSTNSGSTLDFQKYLTCEIFQGGFSGSTTFYYSVDSDTKPASISLTPVWSGGTPSAPDDSVTSFCVEYAADEFTGSFTLSEVTYTVTVSCVSVGGGEVRWQLELSDGVTTVTSYTTSATCDTLSLLFENVTINGEVIDIEIGAYAEDCCDDPSVSDPPEYPPNDCSTAYDLTGDPITVLETSTNFGTTWFKVTLDNVSTMTITGDCSAVSSAELHQTCESGAIATSLNGSAGAISGGPVSGDYYVLIQNGSFTEPLCHNNTVTFS